MNGGAFYGAPIEELTIPKSVTKIETGAFASNAELKKVILKSNDYLEFIEQYFLCGKGDANNLIWISNYSSMKGTLKLPEGTGYFGYDLPEKSRISKIILPSTMETLKEGVFPEFINSIEVEGENKYFRCVNNFLYKTDGSLYWCKSTQDPLVFPDEVKAILSFSLSYVSANEIDFTNNISDIRQLPFGWHIKNNVTTIKIGKNVRWINARTKVFDRQVIVDPENEYFSESNGVLYDKNKTKVVKYHKKIKSTDTISFEKNAKSIGNFAFWCQDEMKNLIIPDGIETIEESAFSECNNVEKVEIPSSIKNIASNAFSDMPKLTYIRMNTPKEQWPSGSPWGAVKGDKVMEQK